MVKKCIISEISRTQQISANLGGNPSIECLPPTQTRKKHKKVCRALNYFEHFLFFVSAVSG